jgi:hypothetical protein
MRIHRYVGRENGLMLIGTASELRRLGEKLLSQSENRPEKSPEAFPPLITDLNIESTRPYAVSVHLETEKQNLTTNFPEGTLRQIILVLLALVGVVAIIKGLLTYVL